MCICEYLYIRDSDYILCGTEDLLTMIHVNYFRGYVSSYRQPAMINVNFIRGYVGSYAKPAMINQNI